MRRIKRAMIIALPLAVALALLAESCGATHGPPQCGPASYVAVPLTTAALVLESLIFASPQGDATVRWLVWIVAAAVALLLASVFLGLAALLASRRP